MKKRQKTSMLGGSTQEFVILSLFSAIIFILAFTPLGLIDLPIIKATILHIPVIIGSIILGPRKGAFLGFIFGLSSLIKNTMAPSLLSFAFSPLIPVPGMDRGSMWALIICFLPRILVGVVPGLIYQAISKLFKHKNSSVSGANVAIAAAFGAFTNTILVMLLIFIIFKDAYAVMKGIPVDAVLGVILGIVGTNGIPEAIVASVISPMVCIPLMKVLKIK